MGEKKNKMEKKEWKMGMYREKQNVYEDDLFLGGILGNSLIAMVSIEKTYQRCPRSLYLPMK